MILYEGNTGMPYEVPTSEVENYIRRGFRLTKPGSANTPSDLFAANIPPTVLPTAGQQSGLAIVNVNTASLKDLTTLPQIGTAIAKQVRDNRPYACVEDLIAKVPGIDWLSLNSRLDYTHDAAE